MALLRDLYGAGYSNMTGTRAIASSMKNEALYILEWVAYHRLIGFDIIVIGSNDSTDGTDDILGALSDSGIVHFIRNVVTADEAPQHAFYEKLQRLPLYNEIEWLAIIDADEFINVHAEGGQLGDLLGAGKDADIIQINWAVFGDNGHAGFSDELVMQRFTRRVTECHRINAGCKCITRFPQRFERLSNHNPARFKSFDASISVFHGGSTRQIAHGANLTSELQYTAVDEVSFRVAQINHYAIKSKEEYMFRRIRGNGALPASRPGRQRYDDRYFSLRSHGDVEDLSILRHLPALHSEIEGLLNLPGVQEATRAAQRHHDLRRSMVGL